MMRSDHPMPRGAHRARAAFALLGALAWSVIVLASVAAASWAAPEGRAGSSAADALLRGIPGGRAAALGGAYAAIAEGPLALRFNPAGLGQVERKALFFAYDNAILDIGRSDAFYATPAGEGGFGGQFTVVDYGTITRTTTANKINAGTFGASEYLGRVGYGRRLNPRLALGGSIALFRLDYDDVEATGYAGDVGLLYLPGIEGVRIAAVVRNLGQGPRFFTREEDLPTTGAVGVAWRPGSWWHLVAEYEEVRNQGGAVRAGIEFTPVSVLAIRAGFDGRADAGNGLAVGFGAAVGDLKFDYAYVPYGEIDQSHRVSAEVEFGASVPRPEPRSVEHPAPVESRVPVERPRPTPPRERPVAVPRVPSGDAPAAPGPGPADASSVPPAPSTPPPDRASPSVVPTPATPPAAPAPSAPMRGTAGDGGNEAGSMRRAAPEDPAHPYLARAEEAALAGDEEREMEWYRRVLAQWPDHLVARYNLATLHYLRTEWREARAQYLEVVTREGRDAEAWLYLAVCESRLGARREAREALMRVLAIDPGNAWARRALGR